MKDTVTIVDRGRGPQLATNRITVQDVVPYLQNRSTYAEILEAMPALTVAEIQAIERYVADHYAAVMEQDRRIRQRAAARRPSPEAEEAERRARLERLERAREKIRQLPSERNGDRATG